jgi:hypothetical protein
MALADVHPRTRLGRHLCDTPVDWRL